MGFLIEEMMSGEHEFEPGFGIPGKLPMSFKVTWGAEQMLKWLNPASEDFLKSDLEGTVSIDGLCQDTPCKGSLELRYFKDQSIRYTFDFSVDDKEYHYVGEKVKIYPWNLPWSHTTCYGRLTRKDTDELISTSITYFRLKTAPAFLASLRLT